MGPEVVPRYPMSCYDGLQLVANALQQTGSTQTMASLIATIKSVASNYDGCTGPIVFNSADDRASGSYDLYEVDATNGSYQWINLDGKIPVAPENMTASQGAYASSIKVLWNPISGATSYELWGSLSAQSSGAVKVAGLTSTAYELTGMTADLHCYFWVKALNTSGTSGFGSSAEGWAQSTAGPCIRINGSSAAVAVALPDTISVTIELDPGLYESQESDWWILVNTPVGW